MTTDTFLDGPEVIALTNKKVRPAQVRVLRAMGIEHKVRPDGSVAILRAHITKVFGGVTFAAQQISPNWDAI